VPATIRLVRGSDAAAIREILVPIVRDTVISFELEPPSEEELRERMREVLALTPWLVLEKDGRLLGYAYAGTFRKRAAYRWTVETSIYVHHDARGRGVGRTLYATLLECLRLQGFRLAIGGIALPNDASVSLHESLGFTKKAVFADVGWKLGRWVDVGFWEYALFPASAPLPDPRPFTEFAAAPEFRDALCRAK